MDQSTLIIALIIQLCILSVLLFLTDRSHSSPETHYRMLNLLRITSIISFIIGLIFILLSLILK